MSKGMPPGWLSIKGSEFEVTGREPKGPFEDKQVAPILRWLFSRGWHRASIPEQGWEGVLGMRMDIHIGIPAFCSVLEAYRNEVQVFRSELDDEEPE